MLYYTTYININLKTVIKAKQKTKKHKNSIKYNNSLKLIVVRRLSEQHVIQK